MGPTLKRTASSTFKKGSHHLQRSNSATSLNRSNEDNGLNQVEEEEDQDSTSNNNQDNDTISVNSMEREMTLKDRQEVKYI